MLNAAEALLPTELRSLEALHLATAQLLGENVARVVTYDQRMAAGARARLDGRGTGVEPPSTVITVTRSETARPYRAATIAELGAWLAGAEEDSMRWRLVAEFLEEYSHEPAASRFTLLEPVPPATGDHRWDVLLASLAEHLAAQDMRGAAPWTEKRRLRQFWFPFNTAAARVDAIVHAPAAFRRRGVFVAVHELDVA